MSTTPAIPGEALGRETLDAIVLADRLADYIPEAWKIAQPAVQYIPGWHIGAMAEHLQAVSEGQIRFLVISVAPRHMKSYCTSVFWPTWGGCPERR